MESRDLELPSPHSVLSSHDLTRCPPFQASPFPQTPSTARQLVLSALEHEPIWDGAPAGASSTTCGWLPVPWARCLLRLAGAPGEPAAPIHTPIHAEAGRGRASSHSGAFLCHLLLQRLDELQPSSPAPAQLVWDCN